MIAHASSDFDGQTRWPTRIVGVASAFVIFGLLEWRIADSTNGIRPMALGFIGLCIGAVLLGTNFGFSSAFRRAIDVGDFSTFRAHALMFSLASILVVPMLSLGSVLGYPVTGFATPIGVSFITGAALFGMGMQMSGGCASGTLFLLGGGNLKFVGTLAAFVLGSTIGAAHISFWRSLPALPALTVFDFGYWPLGLAISLFGFGIVGWTSWKFGTNAGYPLPRSLLGGAVCLALLNAATVVIAGRPWSETYGFALWGSKIAKDWGFSANSWSFWQDPDELDQSVFANIPSIMDMSIIVGAFLAGVLTKRLNFTWGGSARAWAAAALGGLMMGYGARLSGGCNIGAYFSALASGDFSGWVWAIVAMTTTGLGIQARRWLEAS